MYEPWLRFNNKYMYIPIITGPNQYCYRTWSFQVGCCDKTSKCEQLRSLQGGGVDVISWRTRRSHFKCIYSSTYRHQYRTVSYIWQQWKYSVWPSQICMTYYARENCHNAPTLILKHCSWRAPLRSHSSMRAAILARYVLFLFGLLTTLTGHFQEFMCIFQV